MELSGGPPGAISANVLTDGALKEVTPVNQKVRRKLVDLQMHLLNYLQVFGHIGLLGRVEVHHIHDRIQGCLYNPR